jgi:hypothetical protein
MARNMKNIMEMDGAFPAPDDDDLIPSTTRSRAAAAVYTDDDNDVNHKGPPILGTIMLIPT